MPSPPAKFVWMDGEHIPWEEAKVHVLTHCLHYGTGVFEGIRAYPADGNLYVFRLKEHLERLLQSAKIYHFKCDYTVDYLAKIVVELLRKNELREYTYVRPLLYVGYGEVGLDYSARSTSLAIATVPFKKYFAQDGLKVCVSSWRRIPDFAMPTLAKGVGNYLNSALAKAEAKRNSYDEANLLDHRGFVSEGTGENIFLVRRGILRTPQLSSSILEGITRATIITLADDLDIKVVEDDVTRAELYTCDEAFLTGTAAEVAPILAIDGRTIGNGGVGEITLRLREAFEKVIRNKDDRYRSWLTPVY